jgi:hypothetical protein
MILGQIWSSTTSRSPKLATCCFWFRRAVLVLLVPLTGCYRFVPIANSALPTSSSSTVRLRLSDAGSAAMEGQLGTNVREIEGTVVSNSADTVVVNVREVFTNARASLQMQGVTARVDRGAISQASIRVFDRRRSILLGIGAGASMIGIATAAAGGSVGGNGTPPVPPIQP